MRGSPVAPCGPACGAGSCRVVAGTLDAHGAIVAWAKRRRKRKRKRHRRSPLHAGARTATRTRTRSSIPSPPMPAVATQPDSQSNKDGAEKRQLHRSYLVHTHAHAWYRARTQVNTHARTYTHTDSACVERAHTGATSMINLPQPLLCFETTRR